MTQLKPKTKLHLSIHTLRDRHAAKDKLTKLHELVNLSLDTDTPIAVMSTMVKKKEVEI